MELVFSSKNYSLEKTLLSGQTFRWNAKDDRYIGIIGHSVVEACSMDNQIRVSVLAGAISESELCRYFAIEENYDEIVESVSKDEIVKRALQHSCGYRIVQQEPFETLISFIDSANNSVRNIRTQIDKLCKRFGEKITDEYYSFPTPSKLASLDEQELREVGVGFRAKYILAASRKINDDGILEKIDKLNSCDAIELLTSLPGVGQKIADCVLLFAYHRLERIPLDVWVKRVLHNLYALPEKAKYEELEEAIQKIHPKYAGYALQFLYEAARKKEIKV